MRSKFIMSRILKLENNFWKSSEGIAVNLSFSFRTPTKSMKKSGTTIKRENESSSKTLLLTNFPFSFSAEIIFGLSIRKFQRNARLSKRSRNQSCMRYAFHWRLVFWNSIHQEVASDSFCFLINSSWLLVFILNVFSFFTLIFNFNCWFGIHIS